MLQVDRKNLVLFNLNTKTNTFLYSDQSNN
jgi:hypothetical protein